MQEQSLLYKAKVFHDTFGMTKHTGQDTTGRSKAESRTDLGREIQNNAWPICLLCTPENLILHHYRRDQEYPAPIVLSHGHLQAFDFATLPAALRV
jgi:hypothetical protein